jgi:VWFA-related protein
MRSTIAAAALALAGADLAAQTPTFSVSVDAVRLDVLVTDRGRPVPGLAIEDFELRDNGVIQRIRSVTREEAPLDVMLVLDRSASVTGEPLQQLRNAARALAAQLSPQDQVSLLTFSQQVTRPARLSADRAALAAALAAVAPSGATALFDAVYTALVLRAQSFSRTMILVFSDGLDTASWMPPSTVVEFARQIDAVVYAVLFDGEMRAPASTILLLPGRTPEITSTAPPPRDASVPGFLAAITAVTGGQLLRTPHEAGLRDLFVAAVRDMKSRYVVTYTPEGVERSGWHALDLTLTRKKGVVTARKGYFVSPQER